MRIAKTSIFTAALVLLIAIPLALNSCSAPPAYYENVKRVFPAVVRVVSADRTGSGVIVTKEGYVLTGQHVVGNDKTVTLQLNNGAAYQGNVITADQARDLAVISLPDNTAGYPFASLGSSSESDALQTGSPVLVIGYPAGNDIKNLSLSTGTLCAFPKMQSVSYLQSDAKVYPGSSGGPMTNSAGEVIGLINSQYTNMEGRCSTFATASSEAKALLDQVIQGKPAPGPVPATSPAACSDVGCHAPDFNLPTADGKQVSLNSLKGKKVILAFVSTRCSTCLETMVCMQGVYGNWPRDQVEIVAITSQEKAEDVQRWIKTYGFNNPVLLDSDGAVYNRYRPDKVPTLYFLNGDGDIKIKKYPPLDDCGKTLDALLRLY
jgi:peroxiredoxin/V8-like Glu-specific endopeptidase